MKTLHLNMVRLSRIIYSNINVSILDFGLTQYNGNPWLAYRLPGEEVEGAYTMMAVAEDGQLDTWFIGTAQSGDPMTAFSRQAINYDY